MNILAGLIPTYPFLMRYLHVITAFLLIDRPAFSAHAQQDSIVLDNIINKNKNSDQRPVEKVYIHFDKPYYTVADTIWFKAYVTMD